MVTAPYNPPAADLPGKPYVPPWDIPPVTKETHNFADLHVIDLSMMDSPDPKVVQGLVDSVKKAIREDGFLFLENYGISLEQLHRQFAIAQYGFRNMSDEDKQRLLFNPEATGRWAGYKHDKGFKRVPGLYDGIEQFNWYAEQFQKPAELVPTCLQPFQDEITAFADYLSDSVNRRLLILFSRVLELPDDYLWNHVQSHGGPVGEGYYRHALFSPQPAEIRALAKNKRMHAHTDFGISTLLFSVPVSCLQIWGQDEKWYYAPYRPGALVVNIGETLEIISGGHFKATKHRVFHPPEDQADLERLSIVLFEGCRSDIKLEPIACSPLIQREGTVADQGVYKEFKVLMDAGVPTPSPDQWRKIQIQEATDPSDTEKNRIGVHETLIGDKLYQTREYFGVKVLIPV